MHKIISVWFLLKDGGNKGKVALQKRSLKNKSFQYICQATWSGKVELEESLEDAISRECGEELGQSFCRSFDFSRLEFIGKNSFISGGEDWEVNNYFAEVFEEELKLVKLHDEAFPDFIFAGNKNINYFKKSGKDPKDNIVLFDDQCEILNKILNEYKGNK